jgi:hypothetical protein
MDVIKRKIHSIRRVSKLWNIPMNFFVDHINEKTKSRKMTPKGVFTKKEDVVVITWTLTM